MIYALLQSNVVQNVVEANSGDPQDPAFVWIDVTNVVPGPQVNWVYSNGIFSPPGLPNDAYGNSVTFSTSGTVDSYVAGTVTFQFPAGTPQPAVYLSIAIQENLTLFQGALQQFIDGCFNPAVRMNFIALFVNAQQNSLTNRITYISQLFTWTESVIGYAANYVAGVKALTDPAAVAATVWNFSGIPTPPNVTPFGAVLIPN